MLPDDLASRGAASLSASIDEIRKIANTTFSDLQDQTQTKARQFSNAEVGHAPFTSYPVAQALATQHDAAYAVFNDTINGVLRDLERFKTALLDSAKEYENTDDAAAAALAAVDGKFDSNRDLDTQQAFDNGRYDQGSALEIPTSDDATPSATPATSPTQSSESGPAQDGSVTVE